MHIYVAGPYSGPDRNARLTNTHKAMEAGYQLMKAGHIAYIPHLTHFLNEHAILNGDSDGDDYEMWMKQDFAWLAKCDGLLLLEHSPGADRELQFAEEHGLQIFYSERAIQERL